VTLTGATGSVRHHAGVIRVNETARRLEDRAFLVLAMSRPWFWPVSWVPAYLGIVMAGRGWLPAASDLPRVLVALVILGPFVWGAVLAQNDLHDLPSDRDNPRKAGAPLVAGSVTARRLARWYRVIAGCTLAAALYVGGRFVLGVAGVLVLGWAYSAPPLRLKVRPGADVAVNALVVGVVAPLAGWSITRSPWQFPWLLAVLGFLFAAALYLPTTVIDLPSDRAVGDTTFAVRFGARFAYWAGVGCWAAALAGALLCSYADFLVPRTTFSYQLVMAPVLLAGYALLTRRPSILRLAWLSVLFLVPTIGFAAAYLRAGG
jgi:4-hydroxybenzoate polyprenyltransferase